MPNVQELVHLGFQRQLPHPALRSWIECYWCTSSPSSSTCAERLYPDGGSSLMFDLASGGPLVASFAAPQTPQNISLAGPLIGVKFLPWGAHQLLGLPMHEIGGGVVHDAHLLLPRLSELCERLATDSPCNRIKAIDEWMLERAQLLQLSESAASISSVISFYRRSGSEPLYGLGVSRRTVERQVKEKTGNTLKRLLAWSRVHQARRFIKLNQTASLTEIGLTCGYYDQAHFIREFKKFTDFTPRDYRRRQARKISNGEMKLFEATDKVPKVELGRA